MCMYDNLKISTSLLPLSNSEKLYIGENLNWQTKYFKCSLSTLKITNEGNLRYSASSFELDKDEQ